MSAETDQRQGRIVVGVDGSPVATEALRWAVRQARTTGAAVTAVIAWQLPAAAIGYGWPAGTMVDPDDFAAAAERALSEACSGAVDPASGVRVEQQVLEGYPAQVLLAAARDADLLVVGSRGHSAFADALLGSVSQHCAHHATRPVVIIRGRPQSPAG